MTTATPAATPAVSTGRPVLLLDFDGPLNVDKWRPGFVRHRIADEHGRVYMVAISPAHGRMLNRLASDFDLVWATTWWRVANEAISPLYDLPTDLPHVPLPHRHDHPVEGGAFWKTPHIRRFAAGRPFVWLDDEASDDVDGTILRGDYDGTESIYADTPPSPQALVVNVPGKYGIGREHIDAIRAWRAALSEDR